MNSFHYIESQLFCENTNLDILAEHLGTPLYVYSQRTFVDHYQRLAQAFEDLNPTICYSIKSCSNIELLKVLTDLGSGMDVVSGGELYRAKLAGAPMEKVVYAGVGKTDDEIAQALEAKIGWFNIESEAEFENVRRIAKESGQVASAALRVNPDEADNQTHAKTTTGKRETKFGVDLERALQFFAQYSGDPHLQLRALHTHIGSPIYSPEPYERAIKKTLGLIDQLRAAGHTIDAYDIGGGFMADYEGNSPSWDDYARTIVPLLRPFVAGGGQVILEPGRTLSANAGVLLTRVQYIKQGGTKKFVICDAGMNHQLRTALYDAYHFIWPTRVGLDQLPLSYAAEQSLPALEAADIVGPVCETGDFFARDRKIPKVQRGDLLCLFSSGAYGMSMASQYNSMPRPAEVLVDGDTARVIRERETREDLVMGEGTGEILRGLA